VPAFERMLVRSGIIFVKDWLSITNQEQQLRFLMRIHNPIKPWKRSPLDMQSRATPETLYRSVSEGRDRAEWK
jgi:polyphosphate kinase